VADESAQIERTNVAQSNGLPWVDIIGVNLHYDEPSAYAERQ